MSTQRAPPLSLVTLPELSPAILLAGSLVIALVVIIRTSTVSNLTNAELTLLQLRYMSLARNRLLEGI